MTSLNSDIAFTPAVKARQERYGSREKYAKHMQARDWSSTASPDLAAFLAERDSFYMATVNGEGQPYIQHRGGPKGFLKVLDDKTLGFADFAGNRQYISLGNLDENDRVSLFFMDYANRQRIKLWARAKIVEDDPALLEKLTVPGYRGRPQRAFLLTIEAWDVNCPQHITRRFDEDSVALAIAKLQNENDTLRAEIERLKAVQG